MLNNGVAQMAPSFHTILTYSTIKEQHCVEVVSFARRNTHCTNDIALDIIIVKIS